MSSQTQGMLITSLREGLSSFLQSDKDQKPESFRNLELLILEIDEVPQGELHESFVSNIAKSVIAILLERSKKGQALSKEAAACLASLIRRFGSPKHEGESA